MVGKKKGKTPTPAQEKPPSQPSAAPILPSHLPHSSDETYDRFQKLEEITQQLKALSPKKTEAIIEKKAEATQPEMDGKMKDNESIKEQRKRKAAEKAAQKIAAAEKKAQKAADQPPSQQKPPKTKVDKANQENAKSDLKVTIPNDASHEPKPALKQISPNDVPKEKNLQPGNNMVVSHTLSRPKSKFILATPFNVHPAFRRLAAKCEANKIPEVHELLYEFHGILIQFVHDYEGEPDMSFKAALKSAIQPQLNCLSNNSARPFPLAMGNLIRQFRKKLNTLDENMGVPEIKENVIEWIKGKREENFDLATKAITEFTLQKLRSQSHRNILTYSRCPIVEQIILTAAEENLDIHVFVVDSPYGHGKVLLDTFSEQNIPCTYGELSSLGYLIDQVSLVLLGCSGILSNGRVVASRGSSLLALCAQSKNIPVLVAAKTCTFVDKVRLDEHLSTALLSEPIETIPEDLVTALVTDLRILPSTSAPAVLKAKQLANED